MDEATAKALIENPYTLYLDHDEKGTRIEDDILTNEELLKQLAELWRSNEPAIRFLVRAINADLVKYMVEKAKPVETVGLRHELQGAEKIIHRLIKYSAEYERFEKKQGKTQETETTTNPAESPPVEEGKEGAL